jgi:DNA repair protein RadC
LLFLPRAPQPLRKGRTAMTMEEMPAEDRPRERLLSRGGTSLSDAELLATLLGSGTRGASALDVAHALLAAYGDLASLGRAEASDLAAHRGVGPAKACALAAALEIGRRAQTPRPSRPAMRAAADVFAFYGPRLSHLRREVFHVMCLDTRHRLLRDARVVEGGLTTCSVLPREVFAPAMREGAPAVVFVHNHPSGDPQPSKEDLALTARLKRAGAVLGIRALDHVIIGEGRYVSLVDEGQFEAL